MKKTEIILVIIFIIGLLFMAFSLPGQNMLMVLALGFLAMVYTFFGFALLNNIKFRNILKKDSYQSTSTARILGSVAIGISLAVAIDGILFRIMFWPGASVMLSNGIIFLAIITIIGIIKFSKNKSAFYIGVFKRTIIIGIIATILFLIPTKALVNFRYRNNPAYAKIFLDALQHPENIEYQKKLQEEREKMGSGVNGP